MRLFLHTKKLLSDSTLPLGKWSSVGVKSMQKNGALKNFKNTFGLEKNTTASLLMIQNKMVQVFALLVLFYAQATYSHTTVFAENAEILTVNDNSIFFFSKDVIITTNADAVLFTGNKADSLEEISVGSSVIITVNNAFISDDQNAIYITKRTELHQPIAGKTVLTEREAPLQIAEVNEQRPEPEAKPAVTFKDLNSESNTTFVTNKQPTTSPVPASHQYFPTLVQVAHTKNLQNFKEETLSSLYVLVGTIQSTHSYFFSRPPPFTMA